ncbi:Dak1 domain-containing protein [Radiomyces spectabilis]|uniref:Dak1 domain-containing protein n=1 Tax=Radiomyces spectabilis TaxID=64574 RepID=UPI002220E01E|nr:Dak1 domain-containing protein [Radiomyces spectabilis]KAI8368136.1 Dak1 domain-containing protein [Radiomyces spectabilis]
MTCTPDAPLAKHIINDADTLVEESIQGLCYAYPHLRYLEKEKVVYSANVDEVAAKQVTLVAGGGSGHEPAHAGSVGDGMLTAAVCGQVFASPSAGQVLAAIERIQSPHGTLVIVKNYTGDCINFGLAVERAKAHGIKVEMVVIGDDISVGRAKGEKVGRRGMAATTLIIKILGGLAARGGSLEEVRALGERLVNQAATLAVGLDHCHVPGSSSLLKLGPNEIELGMGVHNEPGFTKTNLMSAKPLVRTMMGMLIDQDDKDRAYLTLPKDKKTRVILFVNNLGGTAMLEFNLVVKEAVEAVLATNHLYLERVIAGPFVTSLNMPGFSLSLLTLDDNDDTTLSLLDAPVHVAGWPLGAAKSFSPSISQTMDNKLVHPTVDSQNIHKPSDTTLFEKVIRAAAKAAIDVEPQVTSFDTLLGDGDCGHTMKTAANAVLKELPHMRTQSVPQTLYDIADVIDKSVGGTSSALYCIFFNAMAAAMMQQQPHLVDQVIWSQAAKQALASLKKYTHARPGDRTLMDALVPFVETLSENQESLRAAVEAAYRGAEATRTMPAKLGRTSYLTTEQVESANVPDAGAWGLAALLCGIKDAVLA